ENFPPGSLFTASRAGAPRGPACSAFAPETAGHRPAHRLHLGASMIAMTRQQVLQPMVLFPILALVSVLLVFTVIQGGLALAARWDRSMMARAEYYRSNRPAVLVQRYEQRLTAVRAALRKRGYDAGPADALRSFQRRQGLPVTGRADESTLTALGIQP